MKHLVTLIFAFVAMSSCLFAQIKAGKVDTVQHATIYSCPHHPKYVSGQPGKCPTCGMELSMSAKEQMKANTFKNYSCPVHVNIAKHNPGKCPKCGKALSLSQKEQMKAETVKLYTCPMHPDVSLTKDGVCPKCGKVLAEKKKAKKSK